MHAELNQKYYGKKPLENMRHSWKDNNEVYFKELGCKPVECIQVSQNKTQCFVFVYIVIYVLSRQLN